MTAMQRAQEMMLVPRKDLPPLATEFAQYLCGQVGMCGEVFLTSYAVYAQIVEKKVCRDDLYWPDREALEWFAGRGYRYEDVKRRQPNAIGITL